MWANTNVAMDHTVLNERRATADEHGPVKLRLYLDGEDVHAPWEDACIALPTCVEVVERGAARHLRVGRIRTAVRAGQLRHRLPQVGIGKERAQRVPHPRADTSPSSATAAPVSCRWRAVCACSLPAEVANGMNTAALRSYRSGPPPSAWR